MKRNIIKASLLSLVLTTGIASAQVAISTGSTPTPDPDAVLMLIGDGTKQGFILPTVNNVLAAGMPIKKGMVVYDLATNKIYYCDGSTWAAIGAGSITTTTSGVTITGNAINIANATTSQNGLLTAADWNLFNSKIGTSTTIPLGDLTGTYGNQVLSNIKGNPILFTGLANGDFLKFNGTNWINSPASAGVTGNLTSTTTGVTITGGANAVQGAGTTVNIQNATTAQPGLLTAADWNNFNGKLTNPMTNPNEMIIGGAAGAAAKLNAPAANQLLTSNGGGVPTWNSSLNLTGNIVTTGNINGANIVSSGTFSGDGSSITNLKAGNIASGTLGIANGGTGNNAFAANVVPRSNGALLTTSNINSDGTNVAINGAPSGANKLNVTTALNAVSILGTNSSAGASSIGIRGDANGAATTNYGVYGSATAGTTNWAGYFAGDAGITGNLSMVNLNSAIQFPAVAGAPGSMMYMFASGVSNSDRFVFAHSPAFPNYGLEYQDSQDEFHFNFGSGRAMTFNPSGLFGINQEDPVNSLDVSGNAVIGSTFSGVSSAPANGLAVQGNVGIGTATPGQNLEVFNGPGPGLRLKSTINNSGVIEFIENGNTFGTDALGFRIRYEGLADNFYISSAVNATVVDHIVIDRGAGRVGVQRNPTVNSLEVEGNASKTAAGSWLANSDRRIKTDIQDITNGLDLVKRLRPVKFKYTNEWKAAHPSIEDKYYYNYIAQEYRNVFPNAVKGSGEFLDNDKDEILQIDTYDAQIVSIKAIQEQQAIIEKQQAQINTLTEELDKIKKAIGMEASAGKKKRSKK